MTQIIGHEGYPGFDTQQTGENASRLEQTSLQPLPYSGDTIKEGMQKAEGGYNFGIWVGGNADSVYLCEQNPKRPWETVRRWKMTPADSGAPYEGQLGRTYANLIPADLDVGTLYASEIHRTIYDQAGTPRTIISPLLLDTHAESIRFSGMPVNQFESLTPRPYSEIVDRQFDWGDDKHPVISDPVIYEMHVEGFTAANKNLPESQRGTYEGLASDEAIAHIKKVGANTVGLLPIHQFVTEKFHSDRGMPNYWGYNTLGFFAPHRDYAEDKETPGAANKAFKEMVKRLHQADIAVILDVVYNHTAEEGMFGPVFSFKGLDKDSYRTNEVGNYDDSSTGVGNALNAAHPPIVKMIVDSLEHWVTEYHVDGFRFDLASSLIRDEKGHAHRYDLQNAAIIKAISESEVLKGRVLIAEPWDASGQLTEEFKKLPGWQAWDDGFRDTVRDAANGKGDGNLRRLAHYLIGGDDPSNTINFVTAHDGFTMRDLNAYDLKHNENNNEGQNNGADDNRSYNHGAEGPTDDETIQEARLRDERHMMGLLVLSNGTPMILSGDEVRRSQGGNNNAYCQRNSLTRQPWGIEPGTVEGDHLDFTSRLTAFRLAHPQHAVQGAPRGRMIMIPNEQLHKKEDPHGESDHPLGETDHHWVNKRGQTFGDADFEENKVIGLYRSGHFVGAPDTLQFTNIHAYPEPISLNGLTTAAGDYRFAINTGTSDAFLEGEGSRVEEGQFILGAFSTIILERISLKLPVGYFGDKTSAMKFNFKDARKALDIKL